MNKNIIFFLLLPSLVRAERSSGLEQSLQSFTKALQNLTKAITRQPEAPLESSHETQQPAQQPPTSFTQTTVPASTTKPAMNVLQELEQFIKSPRLSAPEKSVLREMQVVFSALTNKKGLPLSAFEKIKNALLALKKSNVSLEHIDMYTFFGNYLCLSYITHALKEQLVLQNIYDISQTSYREFATALNTIANNLNKPKKYADPSQAAQVLLPLFRASYNTCHVLFTTSKALHATQQLQDLYTKELHLFSEILKALSIIADRRSWAGPLGEPDLSPTLPTKPSSSTQSPELPKRPTTTTSSSSSSIEKTNKVQEIQQQTTQLQEAHDELAAKLAQIRTNLEDEASQEENEEELDETQPQESVSVKQDERHKQRAFEQNQQVLNLLNLLQTNVAIEELKHEQETLEQTEEIRPAEEWED